MSKEHLSRKEEEEYDDLDDLLDEDPSKLPDVPEEVSAGKEEVKQYNSVENEDPEVQEMVNDLQREFQSLMKDQGIDEKQKEEQAKNFNQILETLKKTSSSTHEAGTVTEPQGFKSVVSKTLDRLKENGSKVDSNLAQEEKQRNTDDILSQLLEQLGGAADDQAGLNDNGENMDNAILDILNKMSSKEVLYQPMKEMYVELEKWLHDHGQDEEHLAKMETYKKQHLVVGNIVEIYELETYTNDTYRDEITTLLDELEQLGDSPINKGFNNLGQDDGSNEDLDNIAKLLEISGNDQNLGNLDKELQDTCQQQ